MGGLRAEGAYAAPGAKLPHLSHQWRGHGTLVVQLLGVLSQQRELIAVAPHQGSGRAVFEQTRPERAYDALVVGGWNIDVSGLGLGGTPS